LQIIYFKIGPPEKNFFGSITSANQNFSPLTTEVPLSPSNYTSYSLSLDDFELTKVIGKGGFSKVF
jgi:hypothetical protein